MKKILSFLFKQNHYLIIFFILFAFYCAIIIGISWDENYYKILGKKNLNYLLSLGIIDSEYFYKFRYSTLYWSFSSLLGQIVPQNFSDQFYHLLNTIFGLFTIVGIYKISKILFNKSVAKISSIFLFLIPFFFGHLAINNKDTILALSHVWIFYYLIRYNFKNYEFLQRLKIIFKVAAFAALGSGIQLLFLGSTLPILIFFLYNYFIINKKKLFTLFYDFLIFFIIFYFILILFWVDTHQNIFLMPYKYFLTTLTLDIGWPFNVLNGEYFYSNEAPYYYLFKNLLYKLPEFILFLYIIFLFIIFLKFKYFNKNFYNFNINLLLIFSIIFFPSIIILFIPYPIYDGLRLFLWFVPYLVIIPSLAIYYTYLNLNKIFFKIIFSIFLILFIYYVVIFINITPYQYTYLNFFTGKKNERYQKFEGDYWSVSLKELILKSNLNNQGEIKYTSCGTNPEIAKIYMKKKYKNSYYTNFKNANYLILANRTLYSEKNKKISNCFDEYDYENIFVIKRNGVILSAIKKIN